MKTTQLIVGPNDPVAIIVQSTTPVSRVTIGEDRGVVNWPTTSWQFSSPVWDAANSYSMPPGTIKELLAGAPRVGNSGMLNKGTVLGYMITDMGTTTFNQVEEP